MSVSPSKLPPIEVASPQVRSHHRAPRNRRLLYWSVILETAPKLLAGMILLAGATSALVRMFPYYQSQQEKLRELQAEVQTFQNRVTQLRVDFDRYFDPQQMGTLMQEQSQKLHPKQRRVILVDKVIIQIQGSANSP
ncbi:hypothetical protein BST81_12305 [Leptolyngbya sp. 'hensonii']|uniref:slr1601 family putative cell division protein n=1 Tax=Leptolyngbya sp. 'hensonii' TaxID=1922337 RepID=UPI00094F90D8|nr:hypothetical protein [Leptolyngbya sp. 'hensonii']OLP17841.1 hypothetical protein BST81_12305 [Leptolyngbya sp. 'hensonii']